MRRWRSCGAAVLLNVGYSPAGDLAGSRPGPLRAASGKIVRGWRRAAGTVAGDAAGDPLSRPLLRPDLSPLRGSRDYRAASTSRNVAMFGSQAAEVALLVQAKQLTGSPLALGLLGVAELLPLVAFGLCGGALADRFDRRALMRWCAGLLLSALLPHPLVWPLAGDRRRSYLRLGPGHVGTPAYVAAVRSGRPVWGWNSPGAGWMFRHGSVTSYKRGVTGSNPVAPTRQNGLPEAPAGRVG